MIADYDHDGDVLYITTGEKEADGSEDLVRQRGVDVFCGSPDGYDIVTVEVLGGSAFLPLGEAGYDAETDTLTMGETTDDPERVFENGDFVGYWEVNTEYRSNRLAPIGVSLRKASVHLASAIKRFEAAQKRAAAKDD